MNGIISWNDFLNNIVEIKKYSDEINDDWELIIEIVNIPFSFFYKLNIIYMYIFFILGKYRYFEIFKKKSDENYKQNSTK